MRVSRSLKCRGRARFSGHLEGRRAAPCHIDPGHSTRVMGGASPCPCTSSYPCSRPGVAQWIQARARPSRWDSGIGDPSGEATTVRASGVRRRPSVACIQIWQCVYVYPRALLLAHWQRTHRASDCSVISGQVMLSQLGFGGTRRWAAGFP